MAEFLFTVKAAPGALKELRVEADSVFAAKQFLRRRGIKAISLVQNQSRTKQLSQERSADFIAIYKTPSGHSRKTTIRASNERSARQLLRRRGIKAISLEKTSTSTTSNPTAASQNRPSFLSKETSRDEATLMQSGLTTIERLFEKPPGVKEKAVFASKLAALVDAGVPIVRSLDLMATQQKLPMFQRALTKVSLDVNERGASEQPSANGPRCSTSSASPWWKPVKLAECWMKR